MAKNMSIGVELLTFVNIDSGTETMNSCLEFFGRKCAAVEAAIELDDLQGNIE